MFFVTLHRSYRGQVDEVLIRADLILEVSTRRQTKKAAEYDPTPEEGSTVGGWLLIDRMGWQPCCETPAEVALAMADAEVLYRRRLEAAKVP